MKLFNYETHENYKQHRGVRHGSRSSNVYNAINEDKIENNKWTHETHVNELDNKNTNRNQTREIQLHHDDKLENEHKSMKRM